VDLRRKVLAAIAAASAVSFGVPIVSSAPAAAAPTGVFFSEYVEGSSNNKALEIYNGTGAPIDLASGGYNVEMYFNGSTSAGLTINLTGTVAHDDVFVLAQSSASPAILAAADQTNGAGWYNGDDAVVLREGSTVIDSIGQVGVDPGTEWGSGLTSTADNSLRRKSSVGIGDPNPADAFDPSVEWDGFATDTFGGLGVHLQPEVDCGPPITTAEGTPVDATITATDANGTVVDVAIASVAPTDPGTFSRSAFTPASGVGGTATATVSASGTTPAGTYTLTIVATNDDASPQTGSCQLTVTVSSAPQCGAPATTIHDVQGTGASTPMAGDTVTIEGVVVGDYQAAGQFGGYYAQEEDADADADPDSSEGIFVFDTGVPVAVGDVVRVTGRATEFSGLTELTDVTSAAVCDSGATVTPTTVSLPVTADADWERVEGMSTSVAQELTVTEVFTLARFGEVALSAGGRLDTPTNVVSPGAPALALQDLNDRSRILLDDGNNQQNIDPTHYPQGGLSANNTLRVGDTVSAVAGVLDQRFGAYRIQPVDPASITFTHANPRPVAPASVGGDVRVAAFNVLNYFNGDGLGGGFPTPRGASTSAEFDRQRTKIINAITAMDADVVGLMELENDDTASVYGAIEDLVDGLNDAAGAGTYDFIDTGVVGTDEIRVGIVYQPAAVTPVGPYAVMDSTVDPRFLDTKNRPSLAQTFETADGARFTVVVNHLKSKGSACDDVGDPDTGDGQGNCNRTRTLAAQALVDWLAGDPTDSGDADIVLLGDMNSYAKEDPIRAFEAGGYVNTIAEHVGADAYSFVFEGQSGYLDHALASPSLAAQVTGVTEWHINADEPVALDYNVEFKSPGQVSSFYAPGPYRSSDHDPVLLGLDPNPTWAFDGFFPPVDNPPVVNVLRAGRSVPIMFSLGGDQGLGVLAAGSPSSAPITCESTAEVDPVEPTESSSQVGLTYDPGTDTYTYLWKTMKSWTGCRRLTLTLTDGTAHVADFKFVR
jgi:predicted extracellular nuclease